MGLEATSGPANERPATEDAAAGHLAGSQVSRKACVAALRSAHAQIREKATGEIRGAPPSSCRVADENDVRVLRDAGTAIARASSKRRRATADRHLSAED